MNDTLVITRPDDWHLHVRDGAELHDVLAFTARRFERAIIMPNLKPPVTSTVAALAYRDRILKALPAGSGFKPLMTLYLTDSTLPAEIGKAKASGHIYGVKLYPAGATTNSDSGVTDLRKCAAALEKMAELDIPLLVHGEVIDPDVDIFDREQVFIERTLVPLVKRLPQLRIVFEHISTQTAVDFVLAASNHLAATITPHHLLYNRNALFRGGLRPHYYCLPVLKQERDREALVKAAVSGNPKFFLGTDSAPHARAAKESACGCAGIFSAPAGIELYIEAFEQVGALDRLEVFASFHGADFYRVPRNYAKITLVKKTWTVPESYPFAGHQIVPLRAGEKIHWTLTD
ncbi:MAG TPA: dihydroorotase [Gammaproteobacteria bacterium]|nr:dihydroorotase [Gammaproteobacteria bacterium]